MSLFSPNDGPAEYMKFNEDNVGQPQELVINGPYFSQPSMFEGAQRTNKKGVPQDEIVIPVLQDGKPKRLVINGWRMKQAITDAVAVARANDLHIGGTLTLTYTGKVPGLSGGVMAKAYSANYRAPEGKSEPAHVEHTTNVSGPALPHTPAPAEDPFGGFPEPPADPWGNLR